MASAAGSSGSLGGQWLKGTVFSVESGDSLTIMGPPRAGGPPLQKALTLSSLSAPRLGRRDGSTPDEPGARASRDFLRRAAIGRPCTFRVEGALPGAGPGGGERAFGSVFVGPDSTNLALAVAEAGWARVKPAGGGGGGGGGGPPGPPTSPYHDELVAAAADAEAAGRGLWGARAHPPPPAGPPAEPAALPSGAALLAALGGPGAVVPAVVEHFGSAASFRASFPPAAAGGAPAALPAGRAVPILLAGVAAPPGARPPAADGPPHPPPSPFAPVAAHFASSRALHRDVSLTLAGADRHGNLVASLSFPPAPGRPPSSDLGAALLRAGLARTAEWSLALLPLPAAGALRDAERAAKAAGVGLWKGWAPPPGAGTKVSSSFTGTVVEVVSGDCLVVLDAGAGVERRVHLSSVRAPRPPRPGAPAGEPWGGEAREFVRSRAAGKAVSVRLEYERPVQAGGAGGGPPPGAAPAAPGAQPRALSFGAVTLPPPPGSPANTPPANLAELLLCRGLASVVRHRADDERAAGYDSLLTAEAAAASAKKGVHSPKPPPPHHGNDISGPGNAAKAKAHLSFLSRGPLAAVVEHVGSGHRAKLTIPKEGVTVSFSPSGVRAPAPPRSGGGGGGEPASAGEPGGAEALAAVRRAALHRDAVVSIHAVDRGGTFLGALSIPSSGWEWGRCLVGEGLARLLPGGRPDPALTAAQEAAQAARKGVWAGWSPDAGDGAGDGAGSGGTAGDAAPAPAAWRPASVIVSDARGPLDFSVQLQGGGGGLAAVAAGLAAADLAAAPPLPLSPPPAAGSLVAAPFAGDGLYYRARLDAAPKAGASTAAVTFVDFGNADGAVAVSSLRALPPALASTPPLATPASLAFVRLPSADGPQADIAAEAEAVFVEAVGSGAEVAAAVVGRAGGGPAAAPSAPAWGGGKKAAPAPGPPARLALLLGSSAGAAVDPASSVNADLLRAGLARFAPPAGPPPAPGTPAAEALAALADAETEARRRHAGMWEFGDPGSESDDGGMGLGDGGGGRRRRR